MCDPVMTPEERAIVALFLYKDRHNLTQYLNESFVKTFEELGILRETDVAYLENTKSLGPETWTEELLRLLAFRPNGFESLIYLLTESKQYQSVNWLKGKLREEFNVWGVEPPPITLVPSIGIPLEAGRGKFSKKWARRVLQSWRIPFGDCLRLDEDEEEILTPEPSYEKFLLPTYAHQPISVPGTKAYYFYTDSSVLGQGQTSTVFSGYWDNDPNIKVAVKYVHKTANAVISTREIELAKQIWSDRTPDSAHVVAVLDWSQVDNAYYIILEQAWGTLGHALETNFQNLRDNQHKMLSLLQNCAHGLQWVHQNGIAHGDVNPKNVLLFEYPNLELFAKLSDFGYCRSSHQSGSNSRYLSPEASSESTASGDIFSLGVLFHYALSGGQHPFHGESSNIRDLSFEPLRLDMSAHWRFPVAQNIISGMLRRKPEHRPSIAQVLHHPIFWEEEKCLGFLEDVSRALSNKRYSVQCQEVRRNIDEQCNLQDPNFEWKSAVDERFFQRQGSTGTKQYNCSSVLSLVELIRDKAEHYQDMVESLREALFTQEQRPFNRKAYAEYFLTRYSEIVVLLFNWMTGHAEKYECLGALRDQYFEEFSGGECRTLHVLKQLAL